MLFSTRGRYALRVMVDLAQLPPMKNVAPVACLETGAAPCTLRESCPTRSLWCELGRRVNEYLDSVTLADLM